MVVVPIDVTRVIETHMESMCLRFPHFVMPTFVNSLRVLTEGCILVLVISLNHCKISQNTQIGCVVELLVCSKFHSSLLVGLKRLILHIDFGSILKYLAVAVNLSIYSTCASTTSIIINLRSFKIVL